MKFAALSLAVAAVALSACSRDEKPTIQRPGSPARPVQTTPLVNAVPVDTNPAIEVYVQRAEGGPSGPAQYVAKSIGDGESKLTFVYLIGAHCGNAGCTLLILRPDGDSFAPLGRTTVVEGPIRLLSTSTNGRPDIGVQISDSNDGGDEVLLPFDGRRYADNPTVPPARKIAGVEGVIVIDGSDLPPPPY